MISIMMKTPKPYNQNQYKIHKSDPLNPQSQSRDEMKKTEILKLGFTFMAGAACAVYLARNLVKLLPSPKSEFSDDAPEREINPHSELPPQSGILGDPPEYEIPPESGISPQLSEFSVDAPEREINPHSELPPQSGVLGDPPEHEIPPKSGISPQPSEFSDDAPEREINPHSELPPRSGILGDPLEYEIPPKSGISPQPSEIFYDALESGFDLQSELPRQSGNPTNAPEYSAVDEKWMLKLHAELGKLGLTLPESYDDNKIHSFYIAADGHFGRFLKSIKRNIKWRNSSYFLSPQKIQTWSNFVFWHGFDANRRPCLTIRLGPEFIKLTSIQKAEFTQAVVSQVEYGMVHLAKGNAQIAVLVDCQECSPFTIPFFNLLSTMCFLKWHYRNWFECLYAVRLHASDRMSTFFLQKVKWLSKEKYMFIGDNHLEVLSKYFDNVPSFLGGPCSCQHCSTFSPVQNANN